MKITKEAIILLSRIVFSCDPIGKQKDKENENFIARCVEKGRDFDFDEFCAGLLDGSEREMKIRDLALGFGKTDIDYETICMYFGRKTHTDKTLADLSREGIAENTKFSLYVVLIHLLLPVVIRKIDSEKGSISVAYKNDGLLVEMDGLLYLPEDEQELNVGNVCLVHYPLVVDPNPDRLVVRKLKYLQILDDNFLKACRYFQRTALDHSKFIYYKMLKRRLNARSD